MIMFESKNQNLLPPHRFRRRVAACLGLAGLVVAVALSIGVLGYHYFAQMPWIDAVLNATMILTGMGPVNPLLTTPAKCFASGYALFSGLVLITVMAVVLAPVLHRMLHKLHLDEDDFKDEA